MERGSVVLVEPIPGIEWQQFDHRSFGQIGRLVNDKPSGLHTSLQRHTTTVASRTGAQQSSPAYVGESGVHQLKKARYQRAHGEAKSMAGQCGPFARGAIGIDEELSYLSVVSSGSVTARHRELEISSELRPRAKCWRFGRWPSTRASDPYAASRR